MARSERGGAGGAQWMGEVPAQCDARAPTTTRRRRWSCPSWTLPPPVGERNVAVCLCGEERTFAMPLVHKWLKEHVVDSLQADVFAILKEQHLKLRTRFGHVTDSCQHNASALRTLQPINATLLVEGQRVGRSKSCPPGIDFGPAPAQLSLIEECFGMVESHEMRRHRKYHLWIFIRPDLLVFDVLTPKAFEEPMNIPTKPDFIFGGPRQTVRSWLIRIRSGKKGIGPCDTARRGLEHSRYPGKSYHLRAGLVRGRNKFHGPVIQTFAANTKWCVAQEELDMLNCPGLQLQPPSNPPYSIVLPCIRNLPGSAIQNAADADAANACKTLCLESTSCNAWVLMPLQEGEVKRQCRLQTTDVDQPAACDCVPKEGQHKVAASGFKYEDFIFGSTLVGNTFRTGRIPNGDPVKCLTWCLIDVACIAWTFTSSWNCTTFHTKWPKQQPAQGALSGFVHWHYR